MRALILFIVTLFFLGGCSTLHVDHDYDPSYDFSRLAKAAVVYAPNGDGTISLAQQRFAMAIEETLREKGFVLTDRDHADFIMLFHLNVTEKRQLVTDYELVGLYPYHPYYYGTGMVPVTREYRWKEAKIVIDAVDPDGNKIFWRGLATDRLHTFKTPEERVRYTREVVAEILKNFPPTSTDQGEK